jgi:hypothetical protein
VRRWTADPSRGAKLRVWAPPIGLEQFDESDVDVVEPGWFGRSFSIH